MTIFRTKFSSAFKHILHSLGVLINNIVLFRVLKILQERLLHPEKLTVWCALWSEDVIERDFSENDDGTTVTVNTGRYARMITEFCLPAIEEQDLESMWH